MNAQVERGFVAVLAPFMAGVHVREATSSKPHPADVQMVIVACPDCEHVAGPLHRATVKIYLGTPAFDVSEARHRDAAGMVAMALIDPAGAKVAFDAAAGGLALHGFHVRSQSEDIVENSWRSTIEIVVGLRVG